jgi:penicillin-binding protein A
MRAYDGENMIGGSRRKAAAVTVVSLALALAPGCTPPEPVASGRNAATAFVAAWNRGDEQAMVKSFDDSARKRWSPRRLRALFEDVRSGGRISSYEVSMAGSVRQPEREEVDAAEESGRATSVAVPYTLTYVSEAARRPVRLEGTLDMLYDGSEDAWKIKWERSAPWPGIDGAAGFATAYKWLHRGKILDRTGRVLARDAARSRRYPLGALAGTTIGHLEPLEKRDVAEAPGDPGDLVGGSGIEGAFNERLAGRPVARLVATNRKGQTLERLGGVPGVRGKDVTTTLDSGVQRAAEAAYGDTVGGAVVMQPASGDLLAVVSSSPFDPGNYVGAADVEPFNRALQGLYPPGSAMKVVTASAALDAGVVKPGSTVSGPGEYKGVRNFESGVFGNIDFARAVQFSVNTAFAQVAEDLGPKRLTRYAKAFGFNSPSRLVPMAAEASFPYPEDLYDLMWGSIGQAQVLATPMEMASVAATIANGGRRMEPRLRLDVRKRGRRTVSSRTAATMTGLMERVVEGGTGTGAQISGVRVAGKTGTAEVDVNGVRMNHAWFVSFAPAEAPRVAVAVVAELGGVGGEVAAPLARSILERVLPLTP